MVYFPYLITRQIKRTAPFFNLNKAIQLDSANTNFYNQNGDMMVDDKNYDNVFLQYDITVEKGRAHMGVYLIRSNARMKMVQEKYKTANTQELSSKMNATEKE